MLIQDNALVNVYVDGVNAISNSVDSVCDEGDSVQEARIEMFNHDGQSILEYPIVRKYYVAKNLYFDASRQGKVAEHKLFKLLSTYRARGIAKSIHEKEMEVYRSHNFDEIQLEAAWDGVIVWRKLFFDYVDIEEEKKIKRSMVNYLAKEKRMSVKEIETEINKPITSIKSSLLKSEDSGCPSFTEWYLNNMQPIHLIKMCKRI